MPAISATFSSYCRLVAFQVPVSKCMPIVQAKPIIHFSGPWAYLSNITSKQIMFKLNDSNSLTLLLLKLWINCSVLMCFSFQTYSDLVNNHIDIVDILTVVHLRTYWYWIGRDYVHHSVINMFIPYVHELFYIAAIL